MKQVEKKEKTVEQVSNKKQVNKSKDVPLATMVIREYQALNKSYVRTNKRLTIIIVILLVLMTIATTYIVLAWESMNPHIGLIRTEKCE